MRINDVDGTLDPTNTTGPYYGKIDSLIQAAIARWNPVTHTWHTRFRGFVAEYDYVFDKSQRVNQLTLSLADIFEILQQIQMQPGDFGDTPPPTSAGQVFFDNANVDDRIRIVAGNALGVSIVDDFMVIFSGNVGLFESTYSPGESALTAIQEAVDAEFPGVSNLYPDRFGRAAFHGRLAKFDPSGTAATTTPDRWDYRAWKAGDGAAVLASISDTAHIREFAFNRGVGKILNSAYATPPEIQYTPKQLAGQLVTDPTSIGLNGVRSWSKQNLQTKIGLLDSSDALTETKRFATYIISNYAEPRDRVTRIAFRPMRPTDPRAAANFDLLCRADIADSLALTIDSPGGGGFNLEPFFIEGVHEEVVGRLRDGLNTGDEGYDDVTMSFDLSNRALFTTNPFPTS